MAQAVVDIFTSPLKSYITQTLQFYLSKYIKDVQLEGLGVFGGDLVLNDLEIKRHVLQTSLDIPPTFDFSRGFIRVRKYHDSITQCFIHDVGVENSNSMD